MFRFVLTLAALIAAHPLQKKPYNAIKFVRVNGNGGKAGPESRV